MENIADLVLNYVVEDGLVMIAVLYILGQIIKKMEVMEHRFIPPVLLLVSMVLTPLLMGGYDAYNIVQAVLVTGGATLFYEGKKQATKIKEEDIK